MTEAREYMELEAANNWHEEKKCFIIVKLQYINYG